MKTVVTDEFRERIVEAIARKHPDRNEADRYRLYQAEVLLHEGDFDHECVIDGPKGRWLRK